MFVPEYLREDPHLPLHPGTTSFEAVALCNNFYGTEYRQSAFANSQAQVDPQGRLILELFELNNPEPVIVFVDRSYKGVTDTGVKIGIGEFSFSNPLDGKDAFITPPIQLIEKAELDFLKDVVQGYEQDVFQANQEIFYQLSTLLNRYQVMGRWSSGSMGGLSTSGFTLIYYGDMIGVPNNYILPANAKTIAIVGINQGDKKGHLCLFL